MNVDIKDLLKAGIHFGHRTSRWSPKMRPYIWGAKNKIHLIDIAKTAFLMKRAATFLKAMSEEGGSVLWIGTKKAAQGTIQKVGKALNQPYVIHRWIGGTLSNFEQVKKAMTRYLHLQDVVEKSGSYYSKKEISTIQKEVGRLEKNIGGILNISYPPQAVVVVDAKKEHAAVHEALKLGIPVIAMVDTNTDPTGINLVIPANDDATRSIEFVIDYLSSAVEAGKKVYAETHPEEAKAKEEAAKRALKLPVKRSAAPYTHKKEAPAVVAPVAKKPVEAKKKAEKATPQVEAPSKPEVAPEVEAAPKPEAEKKEPAKKVVKKTVAKVEPKKAAPKKTTTTIKKSTTKPAPKKPKATS